MSTTFEPHLEILPESQSRLWTELDAVPSDFVLYGGTGLALQIGHRFSEDFDFFSHGIDLATGLAAAKAIDRSFDPVTSIRALQFFGDGTLDRVPEAMRRDLARWTQQVDPANLPALRPQRGLSPGGMEL